MLKEAKHKDSGGEKGDIICCQRKKIPIKSKKTYQLPSDAPPKPNDYGTYFVYLDVWERLLTALDDMIEFQSMRDVALMGVDTATRAKIVWQVKAFSPSKPSTGMLRFLLGLLG